MVKKRDPSMKLAFSLAYRPSEEKRQKAIKKVLVLKCLGGLLELLAKDPDPKAQEKYEDEFNCKNCNARETCKKVLRVVLDA